MGHEFSDRVREFKRGIVMERYELLSDQSKKAFHSEIGDIKNVKEDDLSALYSRLGRAAKFEGAKVPKWVGYE